jgi:hypothetical protein
MSKVFIAGLLVLGSLAGCRPTQDLRTNAEKFAAHHGWLKNYRRGIEIVQKLSALSPEQRKNFDASTYRYERVAFVGGGAPPGVTNDVLTPEGYYLRVVTKSGKDLRPQNVWWEVLVCGKVLQVLPENKIIVLEVDEEDWIVGDTG